MRAMAMKRAMATATRVAGGNECICVGSKGDSQLDTSHVPTLEPTTELTALVLVEVIFVLKFLYSCAPFWNLAKKWTCLCTFQKGAQEIKPILRHLHPSRFVRGRTPWFLVEKLAVQFCSGTSLVSLLSWLKCNNSLK
jgi:hypothetical protein